MPKIFISHKREDSVIATEISKNLSRHGIENYLDVLDPYLTGDGDVLTNHLRSQLNSCTHLLAVLTKSTQISWWVPFEIGLATEKDFPISSFVSATDFTLPDYLENWPVLRSLADLNKYSNLVLKSRTSVITENYRYAQPHLSYAEAFHKNLKKDLKN
ncbi:toll/interleukin-1 receptor domain-containing protein [Exiguobacterium acetylicum]|uniref:toll/interleukin-1 receptor domain-containing protein n=1 Tax=Exiguobacterium acetylicum TaxID=41170 RepID=UPI0038776EA9